MAKRLPIPEVDNGDPRRDQHAGGRAKTIRLRGYKRPIRTWKAGRKKEAYGAKGKHTTVRVPSDMWEMGLTHGGLSALIRVMWAIVGSDPALLTKITEEAKLYYPYAGVPPLKVNQETTNE